MVTTRGGPPHGPPCPTKRSMRWRARSTLGKEDAASDGAHFMPGRSRSVFGFGTEIRAPPRASQRLKMKIGREATSTLSKQTAAGREDGSGPVRNVLRTVFAQKNSSARPHHHRGNESMFASQRLPDAVEEEEGGHSLSEDTNENLSGERVRRPTMAASSEENSSTTRKKVRFDLPTQTAVVSQERSEMILSRGADSAPRSRGISVRSEGNSAKSSIAGSQDEYIARAPQLLDPTDEVDEGPSDLIISSARIEPDSSGSRPYAVFVGDCVMVHGVDKFSMTKGMHTSEPRAVSLERGVKIIGKMGSNGEFSIAVIFDDERGDCE